MKKTTKPAKVNGGSLWLKRMVIHWSRKFWEDRAKTLPRNGWYVGRTDMQSYMENNHGLYQCIHYAYPPNDGQRVGFFGGRVSALRKAVKYAEHMNMANACLSDGV